MPLSLRQFDLGINEEIESWMRQIYALLLSHRDLAYSSKELRHAILDDSAGTANTRSFERALEVLAEIRAIEKRWVDDEDYYAFHQEFDTESWE